MNFLKKILISFVRNFIIMDETKEDSFKENLDLPRRPVTPVPAAPSALLVSTQCTTEQHGGNPRISVFRLPDAERGSFTENNRSFRS